MFASPVRGTGKKPGICDRRGRAGKILITLPQQWLHKLEHLEKHPSYSIACMRPFGVMALARSWTNYELAKLQSLSHSMSSMVIGPSLAISGFGMLYGVVLFYTMPDDDGFERFSFSNLKGFDEAFEYAQAPPYSFLTYV
ncbi:hypothetical protein K432DRAFT_136408 [Lepidopterella palustris CBS 459.81]|uniref:Uncharacterized protein n=1 Tax=Lepidopterella palustris CBS 459.81 TaxID=1314670 RepID=A0A8E2E3Z6_9PEZI|nr:hypothetical protein K432DRAFT_136408 [Lepidopterella palustris CBS 459.81]